MVLQDAEKRLEDSAIMIGLFKNRFRIIWLLLQVISIGKWLFICFQTFQHFLAFKSLFIWSRKFQSSSTLLG